VHLSPDSRRVVVSRVDSRTGLHDLLVGDLSRQVLTRLDLEPNDYGTPSWSPDGTRLAFSVGAMRHPPTLYWLSLRGGSPELVIPPSGTIQRLEDWSPDGRFLLFESFSDAGIAHFAVDVEGDRKPRLLVPANIDQPQAQFSPDGRWIAFTVMESGRSEVYLTAFPEPGERIRVSVSGGSRPRWGRDGRELYYLSADNQLLAAPIRLAPEVQVGAPQVLFRIDPVGWRDYDVTADGNRFLAVVNVPVPDEDAIAVTVNWPSLLKR
jgi:Tol biopolymer transport system component